MRWSRLPKRFGGERRGYAYSEIFHRAQYDTRKGRVAIALDEYADYCITINGEVKESLHLLQNELGLEGAWNYLVHELMRPCDPVSDRMIRRGV